MCVCFGLVFFGGEVFWGEGVVSGSRALWTHSFDDTVEEGMKKL